MSRRRVRPLGWLVGLLALLALLFSAFFFPLPSERIAREAVLKTNLHTLRLCLRHFEKDHGRGVVSLDQLVEFGYLREVPVDPITGSRSTWRLERVVTASGGTEIRDVRSGSDALDREGEPYRSW